MSPITWSQSNPPCFHGHPHHAASLSGSMSRDSTVNQDTSHLSPSLLSTTSTYAVSDQSTQSRGVYSSWGDSYVASSSTLSLGPSKSASIDGRRKLLLIYIHGFMGEEASFHKFPALVHNLVTISLAESHVVYSKVYPRYKSRRAMDIARDDFSRWCVFRLRQTSIQG